MYSFTEIFAKLFLIDFFFFFTEEYFYRVFLYRKDLPDIGLGNGLYRSHYKGFREGSFIHLLTQTESEILGWDPAPFLFTSSPRDLSAR